MGALCYPSMTVKWTEWGEGSHTKGAGKSKERAGSFCFLFTMDKPGGTKIEKKLKIKMLKMDTSKCECTLGSSRLSPGVAESRQEMDSLYGCRKGTGADSVTGGGHQEELQHHVEIHPPPPPRLNSKCPRPWLGLLGRWRGERCTGTRTSILCWADGIL